MSRVSEYRTRAADLLAQAAQASDLNARIMLLELAGAWTVLANAAERNEQRSAQTDYAA